MVKFYNNLSPTTRLLIQSFLAVLGSVISGAAVAAYQSYTQLGHFDLATLVVTFAITFALLFGKTMYDWVPPHAQQIIQAGKDNEAALHDALQRQQTITTSVLATQGKQVAPALLQAPQPAMIVQAASPITSEHIKAISAQLAVNLASIAAQGKLASVADTPTIPVSVPAVPVPAPYIDPLRDSGVLPVYVPPALADMTTQSVPVPQMPFPVQVTL
jgi:hypothetical protein